MLIPRTPMLIYDSFDPDLDEDRALAALTRGLLAGGVPAPEVCPPHDGDDCTSGARSAGGWRELDERMHLARAVIVLVARLAPDALAGSVAFEVATRARQGGVPAYAVTQENALDAFGARMLDLQLILQASGARGLVAAGRKLARLF